MDTDATRAIAALSTPWKKPGLWARLGTWVLSDDVLAHAKELLDIVDEELLALDRKKHRHVCEAASTLRGKLEHLRDELRGGIAH
jgi:hypothetical protein